MPRSPTNATPAESCPVAHGGGCGPPPTSPVCTGDTGDPEDSGRTLQAIEGGGCGCDGSGPAHPPLPPNGAASLLLVGMLVWLRRCARVGAVGLVFFGPPARALDVELLQVGDGGRFVALLEADPGPAWTPRLALSAGTASEQVLVQDDGRVTALVDDVQRVELGASLPFGTRVRLAVAAPYIWGMAYDGALQPAMRGLPRGAVSVHSAPRPVRHAWELEVTANPVQSAAAQHLLGDPGAIAATWAVSREAGPTTLGGELGASLRGPTSLPGVTVAQQVHYGAAVAWRPRERVPVSLELFGRTPMASGTGRAGWPAEVLASGGWSLADGWQVRGAAGFGVTKGVGAPNWRALAMVERVALRSADRDGDGVANLRDLCAGRPEDRDGYRDADGCPDEDNDLDGIPDEADACPEAAEVHNGHADADGCPDEVVVVSVRVRVSGRAPDTAAWLRVQGPGADERRTVLHDELTTLRLPDGRWTLSAGAPGYSVDVEPVAVARSGRRTVVLELEPHPHGTLVVRVDDAVTGAAVGARVELEPEACPEGTGGRASVPRGSELSVSLPVCTWRVSVTAPDHHPTQERAHLRPNVETVLRLRLAPRTVHGDGALLRLDAPLVFAHDSATLPPDAGPRLDALAEWLAARPDVELVRVEGRADELGGAAYNLALSKARAEAVCAGLVARGVAAERLQALGSGEAFAGQRLDPPTGGTGASSAGLDRQVRFVRLVWDRSADEGG